MIDGEVCALDPKGRSSFQLLQNAAEGAAPLVYYVFDLLFEGSKDLRGLPLFERQAHLEKILTKGAGPVRLSLSFTKDRDKILRKMREAGAEGVVAKLKHSRYECGQRSGAWTKIKFLRQQEFVIVGYTAPRRSRQHFGALLLGYYRGKRLVFAGRAGTGFTEKTLKKIHGLLKPLETDAPLVEGVQDPSGRWKWPGWKPAEIHWVQPRLVAEVRFAEWDR